MLVANVFKLKLFEREKVNLKGELESVANWGIDKKIFSLILDNAKYNDGLVDVLKRHISLSNSLVCDGQFFHIHCGAYVLNLIVQEGLKVIDEAIYNIRESAKYVRGSEGRKIKFAECIAQLPSSCSKNVRQDIMTRMELNISDA
ncbi:hypothetical protein Vadar_003267 [Vaccinium darrowii]|uniref:Uncharacterized protein n=1 Tax=Vaccinium darrowii TaxID=229202 RepID=A0ACB7WXG2_9ERIC|nr:hypothetical protein Vadar_003267 [Vaccinium darrowii]